MIKELNTFDINRITLIYNGFDDQTHTDWLNTVHTNQLTRKKFVPNEFKQTQVILSPFPKILSPIVSYILN